MQRWRELSLLTARISRFLAVWVHLQQSWCAFNSYYQRKICNYNWIDRISTTLSLLSNQLITVHVFRLVFLTSEARRLVSRWKILFGRWNFTKGLNSGVVAGLCTWKRNHCACICRKWLSGNNNWQATVSEQMGNRPILPCSLMSTIWLGFLHQNRRNNLPVWLDHTRLSRIQEAVYILAVYHEKFLVHVRFLAIIQDPPFLDAFL